MTKPPSIEPPPGAVTGPSRLNWQAQFPALGYRDFRLWFVGRAGWGFGWCMLFTTLPYLLYDLTHSSVYVGYFGLAYGAPVAVLTLFGGVLADRMSRRTVMLVTQVCWLVLALGTASLAFLHLLQPWP